jgi:hypothetical protein
VQPESESDSINQQQKMKLIQTNSKKYWSQKAYDRWAAGLDPQDMPLHEAWTTDEKKAANMTKDNLPSIPDGCKIIE